MWKFLCGVLLVALTLVLVSSEQQEHEDSSFVRHFRQSHQLPRPQTPVTNYTANVTTDFITQKLDHFNENDERTWQMRYMYVDEFYEEGGPFFILLQGEGEISVNFTKNRLIYDMAREHNGYLYCTEHRYYGESHPTRDLKTANLKYLNVRQALADLAHFIRDRRENVPGATNSKVILVGGSYSGAMVTWFKKEYPDLATGCWASSAPLLAKVNFYEYLEVVGQSIREVGGENCRNRIQNGIAELEALFASGLGVEARAMLKLCNNFDASNALDIATLFGEISQSFGFIVQYYNGTNIESACQQIMAGADDISGVVSYLLSNQKKENPCLDMSYKTALRSLKNTTFSKGMMRQWMYQSCNEFGFFQTTDSGAQPFGSKYPLDFFLAVCRDAFDGKFTNELIYKNVEKTNKYFGGLNPGVENVYMTHGQLDPWHAVGKQEGELTTIIPGYAHCKDLHAISDEDTPEMRASKKKIKQLVRQWLNEDN